MEHDTTDQVLDAEGAGATALRGSALRSGGYVVGILLSLISVPLIIRHLGLDEFGIYVTITAIVAIISGASELGLTSVGIREWAQRPPERRQELLADLLGARLALTLLGIAGAFLFAIAAGYDATRLIGVGVACVGLLITSLQAALVVPLSATLRQGRIAAADVLRQAVQVLLIVALVTTGGGLVLILATAIPAAIAAFVLTARGVPGGLPRPTMNPKRWWALLKDTLPFAAASAVSVLYLRATVIITSIVATEAATGEFGAAFRVIEVLVNVPSLLVGALFPLLARAASNDRVRLRMALERTISGSFAVGSLVALAVAAGAPFAILVLSGEQNGPATDALRILAAGLGLTFLGSACQYGLLALRKHREILYINVGALLSNVVLTLFLASNYGAVGAAIALAVCEIAVAVVAAVLLVRAGQLRPDVAAAVRMVFAVGVGALVAVLLTPVSVVLVAFVAPLLTFAVAFAIRAIPQELIAMVPRRA